MMARFKFEDPILKTMHLPFESTGFLIREADNGIDVVADHQTKQSSAHVLVETPKYTVSLEFRVNDQPEREVPGIGIVRQMPKKPPSKLAPEIEGLMTKSYAIGFLSKVRARRKKRERRRAAVSAPGSAAASCAVQMDAGVAGVVSEDVLLVAFGVINGCSSPYSMAEVALYDEHQSVNYAGTPRIWGPGTGDDEGWGAAEGTGDVIAKIGQGEEAVGWMVVNSNIVAAGPLTVRVAGPNGVQPLVATAQKWDWVPHEPEFERTVSLHAQALVGGIWLANPQNDKDLDPTSVKGLGVRVAYHLFELLSVEVDVVGASSGESRFEGVDFNGQQGDLVRSAKLGRVSFGGALRLSSGRTIPVLRLGLGLQGASHNAEMEVGGVRMAGPDIGFSLKGFWSIGAGLDMRLGDHFVGGVGVSFDQLVGDPSSSLKAGIHLGYSWKP
jgi:hypothetical protein